MAGLCASSAAFPRFPPSLGGRCCCPQADVCSAAASLPRRILSSSSPPSPRCPGGSAHRPPLSGTAHPLPAAFPSSFSTSRLQLPPPSVDRGARSRTAPFSPGERKEPGAHLRSARSGARRAERGGRGAQDETPMPNAKEWEALRCCREARISQRFETHVRNKIKF